MSNSNDSSEELSSLDISKLKVPDLKKELKNRGLSTAGNKNELVERLQTALKATNEVNPVNSSDSIIDDIEEDLLNDEDDDHLDERESLIADLDVLDDLPKVGKRKLDEDTVNSTVGPPKKVILKRNTSETLVKPIEEKVELSEKSVETSDDKKIVKLSELSVKERLEMRAKKFGVKNLSDDAKKLARAERFGNNSVGNTNSASSIKLNSTNASIDVLKQRAARFGGSVSSLMSDLDNQERKEKRKERFGGTTTSSANGKPVKDLEAAKAARLERFKTAVK